MTTHQHEPNAIHELINDETELTEDSPLMGHACRTCTKPETRYFRARPTNGTSVSVRMNRPITRFATGGIDYIRIGAGAWGGSITHEAAVALHACLRSALAE